MPERLTLADLGAAAALVLGRAGLGPTAGWPAMRIRRVRLEPGGGLTVSLGGRSCGAAPAVTALLAAGGVTATCLPFGRRDLELARLIAPAPGIARLPELGLTVQRFPADGDLPALATCLDARPGGPLCRALEAAARVHLGDPGWRLAAVCARPLRYKAGSRCVLAYHLRGLDGGRLAVVGKLYADGARAAQVSRLTAALYGDLAGGDAPVPRPLGAAAGLGLALSAAIPHGPAPPGGLEAAAGLAGAALARLHALPPPPGASAAQPGREAGRVRQRAERLARWGPAEAVQVAELGQRLARRLKEAGPAREVLTHGGYKPSQLLFEGGRVRVVDFDGAALGDRAQDVGCFLAYLRPASLPRWRGDRDRLESSTRAFVAAYRQAAADCGAPARELRETLLRARLHEAAGLLKIAARRINRLNAPRPGELEAIAGEVADCLGDPQRWARPC